MITRSSSRKGASDVTGFYSLSCVMHVLPFRFMFCFFGTSKYKISTVQSTGEKYVRAQLYTSRSTDTVVVVAEQDTLWFS